MAVDRAALAQTTDMPSARELSNTEQVTALGVTRPPQIEIECEAFVGSLATLFLTVREGKVDLLDVPLAPVCEAFFIYLVEAAGQDLDRASSALAILAYLLEKKASTLLPDGSEPSVPQDDAAPSEPWIQEFAPAIEALKALGDSRGSVYFRPSGSGDAPFELSLDLGQVSLFDLSRALQRLLDRAQPEPPDSMRGPARSISQMMEVVLRALPGEYMPLDAFVQGEFTRSEVVWWFLALLELIRLGQARARVYEGEVEFSRTKEP